MFRGISKNLKKGFEFEEAWLLWEDCGAGVKDAWEMVVGGGGESGLASIKEKIKFCGDELQAWGSSKSEPNKARRRSFKTGLRC